MTYSPPCCPLEESPRSTPCCPLEGRISRSAEQPSGLSARNSRAIAHMHGQLLTEGRALPARDSVMNVVNDERGVISIRRSKSRHPERSRRVAANEIPRVFRGEIYFPREGKDLSISVDFSARFFYNRGESANHTEKHGYEKIFYERERDGRAPRQGMRQDLGRACRRQKIYISAYHIKVKMQKLRKRLAASDTYNIYSFGT